VFSGRAWQTRIERLAGQGFDTAGIGNKFAINRLKICEFNFVGEKHDEFYIKSLYHYSMIKIFRSFLKV